MAEKGHTKSKKHSISMIVVEVDGDGDDGGSDDVKKDPHGTDGRREPITTKIYCSCNSLLIRYKMAFARKKIIPHFKNQVGGGAL